MNEPKVFYSSSGSPALLKILPVVTSGPLTPNLSSCCCVKGKKITSINV